MKLVDTAGKPISVEGVDAKVVSLISTAFEGLTHQITPAISASIDNAMKPYKEKLTEVGTAIESLKTSPTPKPDDKTPDPKGGESEVAKVLAKITEKLDGLEGRINQDKEREAVTALGEGWLKKNAPNLKPEQRSVVLARIVAAKPKDDDGVKQVIDQVKAEYAAIGGEAATKVFSAEPSKEGATEQQDVEQKKADAQAKVEEIKSRVGKEQI